MIVAVAVAVAVPVPVAAALGLSDHSGVRLPRLQCLHSSVGDAAAAAEAGNDKGPAAGRTVAGGSASVQLTVRDSANSADTAVTSAGTLTLVPQPSWYDAALRSATTGSGLAAPSDLALPIGGVFLTLPTSPVYGLESFAQMLR